MDAIAALLAWASLLTGTGADAQRNAALAENVRQLGIGMHQYAVDHGDRYPATGQLVAAMTAPAVYLLGHRMAESPWAPFRQANALPLTGPLPAAGTVLGTGRAPTGPTFTARDFGAIVYRYDPKEDVYAMYGVGADHGKAIVVAPQGTVD